MVVVEATVICVVAVVVVVVVVVTSTIIAVYSHHCKFNYTYTSSAIMISMVIITEYISLKMKT